MALILLTLVVIPGCLKQTPTTTTTTPTTIPTTTSVETTTVENDLLCDGDFDCTCGVHIETGDCFYGNKEYVDFTRQCPDFCSGFAGNLRVKCIEGECTQVQAALGQF